MKLERLHEYVLPAVATLGGMGFAIYCARLTGNGQMGTLAMLLGGALLLALTLILRQAIWLFLPMMWGLVGQIPVLPLPFAVRDLVVMSIFVCFLIFISLKIVRRKPQYGLADLWLGIMLAYLLVVFIRNPVGVDALGSSRVGGRPYFNVFIAFLAYLTLTRCSMPASWSRWAVFPMAVGQLIEGLLGAISYHFPRTLPWITQFYVSTAISTETYNETDVLRRAAGEGTGRRAYLMFIGQPIGLLLVSIFRPLTLINPLYLVRFAAFALTALMLLGSGFRSTIATLAATFLLSSYFRRGWAEVLRIASFGLPLLGLILLMQGVVFDLPLPAQRALSFLPGRWDELAVREAQGSTQWRVEMWKTILGTDKYIESKWFGDGFGFTRRQLDLMRALQRYGATPEEMQENMMVSGGVHSGPISAIRYVGYVGLAIFLTLLIAVAMRAWKLIRQAQNTPFFMLALFIGIPCIWEPVLYTAIFGGFEGGLPETMFRLGLLHMLANSLRTKSSAAYSELRYRSQPEPRALSPVGVAHGSPHLA